MNNEDGQTKIIEKLIDQIRGSDDIYEDGDDGLVIQLIDVLHDNSGKYIEQEKEFVKLMPRFQEITEGLYGDIEEGDSWYWHAHEIVKGDYPLEKLPDHVRNLAKELYY